MQSYDAFAHQSLSGLGIDGESFVESVQGVPRFVLLQEERARFVFRGPEILLDFQGVRIDFVEDELELVGDVVPAGIFTTRQAHQQQQVRVFDVRLVVLVDKPPELDIGFLEITAITV